MKHCTQHACSHLNEGNLTDKWVNICFSYFLYRPIQFEVVSNFTIQIMHMYIYIYISIFNRNALVRTDLAYFISKQLLHEIIYIFFVFNLFYLHTKFAAAMVTMSLRLRLMAIQCEL